VGTGFADILHTDGRGDHGFVDNARLPTIRSLLLLYSDTGTRIPAQVSLQLPSVRGVNL